MDPKFDRPLDEISKSNRKRNTNRPTGGFEGARVGGRGGPRGGGRPGNNAGGNRFGGFDGRPNEGGPRNEGGRRTGGGAGRQNVGGNASGVTSTAKTVIARVGGGGGVRKPRRQEEEQVTTIRTGGGGASFRGGRGPSTQRVSSADADGQWSHDLFEKEVRQQINRKPRPSPRTRGTKVQIKNLHYEVNDKQLKSIFSKDDGEISKVVIHYDKDGRSLGTADVFFINASDALRAANKYDQAKINGFQITTSVEEL